MKVARTFLAVALLGLAAAFAYHTYREYFPDLNARTENHDGPTEQRWMVDEITRDIAEILWFAAKHNAPSEKDLALTVKNSGASKFEVKAESAKSTLLIAPEHHFWAAKNYAPWAAALMSAWKLRAANETSSATDMLGDLTNPQPKILIYHDKRISELLTQYPLDAGLHEEAAALLGAFALREAAGNFTDTRPALCRMSAHLAIAKALRGNAPPGTTGSTAELMMLTLAGRQAEALEKITALENSLPPGWATALKIRNTGDWRLLERPNAGTLFEQLECFRARASSVGSHFAVELLKMIKPVNVSEWGRVVLEQSFSVEEGHQFAKESIAREIMDFQSDWLAMYGSALGKEKFISMLNEPPTRCLNKGKLAVLSWGDWAAFHQRAICFATQRSVWFLRDMWGVPEYKQFEQAIDQSFSALTLFPLAQKRYAETSSSYSGAMTRAIALCESHPELVTAANWCCLRTPTTLGNAASSTPEPGAWFWPDLPAGTIFDFSNRYNELRRLWSASLPQWEEFATTAPNDFSVLEDSLHKKYGLNAPRKAAEEMFAKITDYNLHAMTVVSKTVEKEPEAYVPLLRKMAAVQPAYFLHLADYYVKSNQPEQAAQAYQKAFDLGEDRVQVSNNMSWLVDYYFTRGRTEDALRIAREGAEVYSARGLATMARLSERMGKLDDAEDYYRKIAERYDDVSDLNRFYLANQTKSPRFAAAAKKIADSLFPNGFEKVTRAEMRGPPLDGVLLRSASARTQAMGIKPGDVFVAIDGYRVHNDSQYMFVRGLTADPNVSFIVWNGSDYIDVKANLPPDRRFGADIGPFRR